MTHIARPPSEERHVVNPRSLNGSLDRSPNATARLSPAHGKPSSSVLSPCECSTICPMDVSATMKPSDVNSDDAIEVCRDGMRDGHADDTSHTRGATPSDKDRLTERAHVVSGGSPKAVATATSSTPTPPRRPAEEKHAPVTRRASVATLVAAPALADAIAATTPSPDTGSSPAGPQPTISPEVRSPKKERAPRAKDDDDDLELSSASSSSSSDDGGAHGAPLNSTTSSAGSPRRGSQQRLSDGRRRQSNITQELLANAQEQQKKLLAVAADGIDVSPLPMHTKQQQAETHPPLSRTGSLSSLNGAAQASYTSVIPVRSGSNASSNSSYITQPIKRQSIADIRRSLSIAPSPPVHGNAGGRSSIDSGSGRTHGGGTSPPGSARGPSNSISSGGGEEAKLGNARVRKFVTEVRDAMLMFRKETGIGGGDQRSVGDASFAEIKQARDVLEHTKRAATAELLSACRTGPLAVDSPDIKRSATQLFDDLVKDGDRRGNAEAVHAMVTCIHSIDFPSIIIARQLHVAACAEGFPHYLDVFLSMQRVQETLTQSQLVQLLQMAAAHPVYRVDLLIALFRYGPYTPAGSKALRDMAHQYQDAFEQAVSLAKAGPMEDRTRRDVLIEEALRCPGLINCSTKDSGDKQTIFSRAAREGDVELVTTLIRHQLVDDVNRIQPDATNALQQAAARGHLKVVEALCKLSSIAPSLAYVYPGRGTALELAMNAKNPDRDLIHILRTRSIELRVLSDSPSESPSASPAAPSSPTTNLDRRSSKASFARKKSISMGAEREEEVHSINGVVDATNIIKILLTAIKPVYEQIKYEQSFDPSGEDLRKLGILKTDLQKAKEAMTIKLSKLEPESQIDIRKEEVRSDMLDLLDRMVEETSKMSANIALFELCIERMRTTFDFATIATERGWFRTAAHNGSVEFVSLLLKLPDMKEYNLQGFQTKEMFEGAAESSIYRVDSLLNLFEFGDTLNIDYFQSLLRPVWQCALEDIASVAKARPQEARANRMQLLKLLVEHPLVQANPEKMGDDRHSVFSRACAEGDAPLVYFLLNQQPNGTSHVKQPNVICADSMTPLMHACANGHLAVVQVFAQLAPLRPEGIDMLKFKLQLQGGNAADVALRKKHTAIVQLLKKHGVVPQTAQP